MPTARDHVAIGHQYAQDIASGRVLVCDWVKLACQRHLDDLARQGTSGFPYRFDPAKGAKVCRFVECFKVFEGPLAGQNIELQAWQCWLLTTLYGWVCDRGPRDGKRRFRRAYIELPRGSGKSALSSALSLYMLAADGEGGAQVVAAGTSRDVAKIVFSASQQMAKEAPDLMAALGVEVTAHAIIQRRTASRFMPISADAKTSDGKNIHYVSIDELHLFKDRRLYDSLETGMGKRDQSLLTVITTAGTDISGICYEVRTYLTKVLNKAHTDESTFGVIYTIPDGMNWQDPKAWQAANPGWGVTVMPEVVEQLAKKALMTPSAQNNFRTKHLCEWMSADSSWMDMAVWRKGSDPAITIDDFVGQPCYIGLDLATRVDLCAKVYLFPKDISGKTHYWMFTTAYLPAAAIEMGRNAQYRGWEIEGRLTITDGDTTDFSRIEEDLIADSKRFDVREVGFDPWQATQLAQRMMGEGVNMVEVRQTVANMSEPMKELQALALQGRLHHSCPVLTWCVSNVVCHTDAKENIYPRKLRSENRIDLAVASIIAMARATLSESTASVYETQGIRFF